MTRRLIVLIRQLVGSRPVVSAVFGVGAQTTLAERQAVIARWLHDLEHRFPEIRGADWFQEEIEVQALVPDPGLRLFAPFKIKPALEYVTRHGQTLLVKWKVGPNVNGTGYFLTQQGHVYHPSGRWLYGSSEIRPEWDQPHPNDLVDVVTPFPLSRPPGENVPTLTTFVIQAGKYRLSDGTVITLESMPGSNEPLFRAKESNDVYVSPTQLRVSGPEGARLVDARARQLIAPASDKEVTAPPFRTAHLQIEHGQTYLNNQGDLVVVNRAKEPGPVTFVSHTRDRVGRLLATWYSSQGDVLPRIGSRILPPGVHPKDLLQRVGPFAPSPTMPDPNV